MDSGRTCWVLQKRTIRKFRCPDFEMLCIKLEQQPEYKQIFFVLYISETVELTIQLMWGKNGNCCHDIYKRKQQIS